MNYFFIIVALAFVVYILYVVKKGEFSAEESIFWVTGAIFSLILSFFPKLIDKIAENLDVVYPPSLLFLIAIFFLLYLIFRNTKKIYKQNEKIIELAQRISIMEDKQNEKEKGK